MPLYDVPYNLLKDLCYMMDPLVAVGADFTTFAAKIGFCTTYIRYVKCG